QSLKTRLFLGEPRSARLSKKQLWFTQEGIAVKAGGASLRGAPPVCITLFNSGYLLIGWQYLLYIKKNLYHNI
ncbi:MAG TPA: hypothetical protein V6C78_35180, partial [Crinalium sp.]